MAPAHRQKVRDTAKSRALGETIVGAVNFRRRNGAQVAEVRFDGLAQALRTAGGGSSIQTLLMIDDAGMFARKITPREAARLMGVPDRYALPAGVTDGHDLVGDGVCVPVVAWLFDRLLAPLCMVPIVRHGDIELYKRKLAQRAVEKQAQGAE